MTLLAEHVTARALDLPPAFTLLDAPRGHGAFTYACAVAGEVGSGALVRAEHPDLLDFAVVLEPEEPLGLARRAQVVAMAALADALGSVAPPEKPVTIEWPDTIGFNGARLGGGRLGFPPGCAEDRAPDWLVFGATLLAALRAPDDPGLRPESTSLDEEGFDPDVADRLLERFARYLLVGLDVWQADGFEAAAARVLPHLGPPPAGERRAVTAMGDLAVTSPGRTSRVPAWSAAAGPAWLDPASGAVRL